jgi:hypothetical protein
MLWIQKLKPAWGGSNFTQKNKILDTFADIVIYHVVLRCVNGTDAIMAKGIEGLSDISKKPHNSSNKKLREQLIEKILTLRNERNIGARRIQLELFIQEGTRLSLASIHKALKRSNVKPIKNLKRDKKFKRYQRPVPSDRVQIDTCKIASGIYLVYRS